MFELNLILLFCSLGILFLLLQRKRPIGLLDKNLQSISDILEIVFCIFIFLLFAVNILNSWNSLLIFDNIQDLIGNVLKLMIVIIGLLSLFKPRFTRGVLFCGSLILLNSSSYKVFNHFKSFEDVCNRLRDDFHCSETATQFQCGDKRISKNTCINNTQGNNTHYIRPYVSEDIGKIIKTKNPLFYVKNLPRNDCLNRFCGYKYETSLNEIENPYSSWMERRKLTTKMRVSFLPLGTSLKIVESFKTEDKYFTMGSSEQYHLVLEDENGFRSEIYEDDLEKITGNNGHTPSEKEIEISRNLNLLKKNGSINKKLCYLPGVVNSFFQDLKLLDQVKINEDYKGCAEVVFRSEEAYLTSECFIKGWDKL